MKEKVEEEDDANHIMGQLLSLFCRLFLIAHVSWVL